MWNSGNSLGIGSTALFQWPSSLCQCHLIPSPGGFCVFHLLAGTSSCSAQQSLGKLEVWQQPGTTSAKKLHILGKNSIFWAKNLHVPGKKPPCSGKKNLHILGKNPSVFWEKTSVFWGKNLHTLGKKPPYSGQNTGSGICGGPGRG